MIDLDVERKAAKRAAGAADSLADALKAIKKAGEDPFATLAAVADARKACAGLRGIAEVIGPLEGRLDEISKEAQARAERSRAALMGQLDDALKQRGLTLKGRLPILECGPLTLELISGAKAQLKLWYGPKIALLGATGLDAEKAADEIAQRVSRLDGEAFDGAVFLEELLAAWRAAVARVGGAAGDRAPIVAVLGEMAAGRQSARWRNDPAKSAYREYTRVQFSHDIGRLRIRQRAGAELVLTVASRDQTKNAADHLWVAGTHYAWLSFREAGGGLGGEA